MKKKALLSSVLTIVLCLSLIAGSTFALFTSESTVNIAVTSGKVNVVATATEPVLTWDERLNNEVKMETTVTSDGKLVELNLLVPGAKVDFDIELTNDSNVTVQYRTKFILLEGEKLWNALTVSVTGGDTLDGTKWTQWPTTEENTKSLHVHIEFPFEATEPQGESCKLMYIVEAVQGNAEMPDEWDGVTTKAPEKDDADGKYHITTAAEFAWLMDDANIAANNGTGHNSKYNDETFVLDCDIDFGGATISGVGSYSMQIGFTFDGNGHTISNFTINAKDEAHREGAEYRYAGLFQQFSGGTIKNLTVRNATVIGDQMVGVIASNVDGNGSVENCKVYDSTVIGAKKVGAVVAYVAGSGCTVKDCYAENCVVYASNSGTDQSGEVIGYVNAGSTVENNTPANVTVNRGVNVTTVSNAEELAAALPKGGYILLLNDLNLSGWETAKVSNTTLTLYGNNKTISGLTKPLINFYGGNCTINDLTVKDSIIAANGDDSTGNLGVGVILEEAQWANLYMDNCHVKNCKVNVDGTNSRAGALVGYWIGGGEIKNCSVVDSVVYGAESAGGIVGHRQGQGGYEPVAKVTDCTVRNTTVTSANYAGAVLGRLSTETFEISGCTYTGEACGNVWDGGNGKLDIK